jgi:hypothetical protein
MKRLPLITIVGALAMAVSSSPAAAACERYGTQLECVIAGRQVVLGTQTDDAPDDSGSLPLHSLLGAPHLPDARSASAPHVDVDLQDFDADSSMCRRYGNETYCY